MDITRRIFLAGSATVIGEILAGAPAAEASAKCYVCLCGPIFYEDHEAENSIWVRMLLHTSKWHFDDYSHEGYRLIRHRETRMTYRVAEDEQGGVEVHQVAPECAPCDEETYRTQIHIGIAARFVAAQLLPFASERHGGRFFFEPKVDPEKDSFVEGATEPAPPIPIIPLTAEAVAALRSEGIEEN